MKKLKVFNNCKLLGIKNSQVIILHKNFKEVIPADVELITDDNRSYIEYNNCRYYFNN